MCVDWDFALSKVSYLGSYQPSVAHATTKNASIVIPARFIFLQDSTIAAADAYPDYTVRPEPNKTVEALKAMQAK